MHTEEGNILPIVGVLVIIFLTIGLGYYFQTRNTSNPAAYLTQSLVAPKSTPDSASISKDFAIVIPDNYEIEDKPEYKWIAYSDRVKHENQLEKTLVISRELTSLQDVCIKYVADNSYVNAKDHTNAQCITINGYKALDMGTDIAPYAMGPLQYTYKIIYSGNLYTINFLAMDKTEKDQILATFKFTH